MSRIEELREECARVERIMSGSGVQACLTVSTAAIVELINTIDHLTAELTAKDAEIKGLREACEFVMNAKLHKYEDNIGYHVLLVSLRAKIQTALAATAGGEQNSPTTRMM